MIFVCHSKVINATWTHKRLQTTSGKINNAVRTTLRHGMQMTVIDVNKVTDNSTFSPRAPASRSSSRAVKLKAFSGTNPPQNPSWFIENRYGKLQPDEDKPCMHDRFQQHSDYVFLYGSFHLYDLHIAAVTIMHKPGLYEY